MPSWTALCQKLEFCEILTAVTGQVPEVLPGESPVELNIIVGGPNGCGGPECQDDDERQESDAGINFSHGSPSIAIAVIMTRCSLKMESDTIFDTT